jgi:hypothetical protein
MTLHLLDNAAAGLGFEWLGRLNGRHPGRFSDLGTTRRSPNFLNDLVTKIVKSRAWRPMARPFKTAIISLGRRSESRRSRSSVAIIQKIINN